MAVLIILSGHVVCLQLHEKLSMGGRGVILHFKRGHKSKGFAYRRITGFTP